MSSSQKKKNIIRKTDRYELKCKCGSTRFKTYMKNPEIYECRICHRLIQVPEIKKNKI